MPRAIVAFFYISVFDEAPLICLSFLGKCQKIERSPFQKLMVLLILDASPPY